MNLKELPIGISSFKSIIKENYLYVDKTQYAYRLLTRGKYYFLSRPRRFGKSLFVATLEEILKGERDLCKDLWIGASDYQWRRWGLISIDFSSLGKASAHAFAGDLCKKIRSIAIIEGLHIAQNVDDTIESLLIELAQQLYEKYGCVAILIDEYDNPLLHNLHDVEKAKTIREIMQGFFATIKSLREAVQFVFIAGISSFSKAGIFSGMNNLQILTLDSEYAGICGYTDQEIDNSFRDYLINWTQKDPSLSYDELREKIRTWYNGYRFGAEAQSVYNPFSILKAFHYKAFDSFWIDSGQPTFLIHELQRKYRSHELQSIDYSSVRIDRNFLSSFDIGKIPLTSLLLQAGYLTIVSYDVNNKMYELTYPNEEVAEAMRQYLLEAVSQLDSEVYSDLTVQFKEALSAGNAEVVIRKIQQFFSKITFYEHDDSERYYHSILQVIFEVMGVRVYSQYHHSHGRMDLVVEMKNYLYVVEIKFDISLSKTAEELDAAGAKLAQSALHQIKDKRYYEPFLDKDKKIILLGIAFNRSESKFKITGASEIL